MHSWWASIKVGAGWLGDFDAAYVGRCGRNIERDDGWVCAGGAAFARDIDGGAGIPGDRPAFLKFKADEHIPGLVWGVVRDGRVVHFGASGVQDVETRAPVNAETMFRIASMSKAFTALAILKLRDEGKLSLDALAETYVPELKTWTYPTTDSPRIRVRDLLSHVGGLVTDDPWGDRQQPLSEADFSAILRAGVPFTRAPQTAFEYSNLGYATLGRIVTNVSGRPYDQYIGAKIMKPLGMNATTYEVRDVDPARLARWAGLSPMRTTMRSGWRSCLMRGRRGMAQRRGRCVDRPCVSWRRG